MEFCQSSKTLRGRAGTNVSKGEVTMIGQLACKMGKNGKGDDKGKEDKDALVPLIFWSSMYIQRVVGYS